jgi:hypothetical protein
MYVDSGSQGKRVPPGASISRDQRRRGEVRQADARVDAARDVAVAGQDGGRLGRALLGEVLHRRVRKTGVADTGHAAEPDDVEAGLLQGGQQTGLARLLLDDP